MKAFLINPKLKEVTEVEIEPTIEAIQDLIGFKTVDSDEIDFNFTNYSLMKNALFANKIKRAASKLITWHRSLVKGWLPIVQTMAKQSAALRSP